MKEPYVPETVKKVQEDLARLDSKPSSEELIETVYQAELIVAGYLELACCAGGVGDTKVS